jgi:hypothetical protein
MRIECIGAAFRMSIKDFEEYLGIEVFPKDFHNKTFTASAEFFQDMKSLHSQLNLPRTLEPTEQEIKEWNEDYEKLKDINFEEIKKKYNFELLEDVDFGLSVRIREKNYNPYKEIW